MATIEAVFGNALPCPWPRESPQFWPWEVPTGGHLKSPPLAESSTWRTPRPVTVTVQASHQTNRGDASMKSAREKHGLVCRLPGGGHLPGRSCDLRDDPQDRQAGRGRARADEASPPGTEVVVAPTTTTWPPSSPNGWRATEGPDLGQAAPAGGASRRLRGLGPEPPPGGRRRQGHLAGGPPPGAPARGMGPRRRAGVRLGGDRPSVRLLRRAGVEPHPLRVLRRQPRG